MSDFLHKAASCVGWAYKHKGRFDPAARGQAVDCWGLFVHIMKMQGVCVPDPEYTLEWAKEDLNFLEKYHEYAEPISNQGACEGDAVLMVGDNRHPNHVGVYLGNDRVIHCTVKAGVVITKVSKGKEANRFVGFFRMKPSVD